MAERILDDEYAICPYCGCKHGDCWELCPSEEPVEVECSDCEKTFLASSSYSVTIITMSVPVPEEKNG